MNDYVFPASSAPPTMPSWFDTLRSMRESSIFTADDIDKATKEVIGRALMERDWNVDDLPFTLQMVTASDEPGDPWRILNAIERGTGRVMQPDEVLTLLEAATGP